MEPLVRMQFIWSLFNFSPVPDLYSDWQSSWCQKERVSSDLVIEDTRHLLWPGDGRMEKALIQKVRNKCIFCLVPAYPNVIIFIEKPSRSHTGHKSRILFLHTHRHLTPFDPNLAQQSWLQQVFTWSKDCKFCTFMRFRISSASPSSYFLVHKDINGENICLKLKGW